jgi:carboxyl-terminal processing protease
VIEEAFNVIRKNHYSDPRDRKLILAALDGIRAKVETDEGKGGLSESEETEGVRWRIGSKEVALPVRGDLEDDLKPLSRAFDFVRSAYYPGKKKARELAYAAIQGMMKGLDPHSVLMPPEAFHELQVETRGEFGGIGIEITIRDGKLTVVSPIDGTPAFRLGVKAGDHIVRIEDFNTKGITLREAVRRMRGPKGTPVTIQVRRENVGKPLVFTIIRDIIRVQSVKSKVLPGKIGYIRLRSFVESSSRDLLKAMLSFKKEEIRGLVLDLRNNPGGLLRQAVQVADLFLGKGSLIVYTRGKRAEHSLRFMDRRSGPFGRVPMVVLVNSGSASASEIVTGALQDLHRALVMGTRTFGKGSVQTIIPLSDGSGLRITTAIYYTPKGREIHAKGIPPDAVVRQPGDNRKGDVVLEKELLRRHKERNKAGRGAVTKPKKPEAAPKPQASPVKPIRLGSEDDYQLSVARRILDESPDRRVAQLMIRARRVLALLAQTSSGGEGVDNPKKRGARP